MTKSPLYLTAFPRTCALLNSAENRKISLVCEYHGNGFGSLYRFPCGAMPLAGRSFSGSRSSRGSRRSSKIKNFLNIVHHDSSDNSQDTDSYIDSINMSFSEAHLSLTNRTPSFSIPDCDFESFISGLAGPGRLFSA